MCQNQRTGGPWSQTEYRMHIKCLELLAATLAVHTFLKNKSRISVLLRLDNTTTVVYIYQQPRGDGLQGIGRPSKEFMDVEIADAESWAMIDQSDWRLIPVLFRRIVSHFGLFASCLTTQCQAYFSWRPDP